jgi:isoamylase
VPSPTPVSRCATPLRGKVDGGEPLAASSSFAMQERSVVVLREHTEPAVEPDHSVAASLAAQVART